MSGAGPGEIMFGYIHNGIVRAEFMASVLMLRDSPAGRLLSGMSATSGGTLVSYARNRLAEGFLGTPCPWLFMVDTDMVFSPDQVAQLAEAADPQERAVIGGACAILDHSGGGSQANLYTATRDETGQVLRFAPLEDVPADGLIQVDGCGAGFLMIHRSVLEKIGPGEWFREGVTASGGIRGEDLAFCVRAADAGFPIWVHCGVRPGHMKTVCVTID